jgi:CubicO group peptidase (beta-lactamase class C family)
MQLRPGTPAEAGLSAARIKHIADLAANWTAQGLTPALVVLVARRGIVVLHEAFGRLASEPQAPPVQLDTLFPLSSITKPITATAAMILVEDGLLGLNRPVCEYIPEFTGEGKQAILVHHLLTHTSGLRDVDIDTYIAQQQGTAAIPPAPETQHTRIHEWLYLGYSAPLWKPPGTEMSYSNYGYELLGEIVRRVSGQSLPSFAQARIFTPLGMRDTYYSVPDSVKGRIVRRPATAPWAGPEGPGLAEAPLVTKLRMVGLDSQEWQETPFAAYGAFSTALDIATFGQMFLNRGHYGETRILSAASVAEMTRNQIPGISTHEGNEFFPEASWGLGWDVLGDKKPLYDGSLCSLHTFMHGGGGGVRLWVDPIYEIIGVYFSVILENTAAGVALWQADLFMNAVTAAVEL